MGKVESGIAKGNAQATAEATLVTYSTKAVEADHNEGMVGSDRSRYPAGRLECSSSDPVRDLTREPK